MNKYITADAKISMIVVQDKLVVLFFQYSVNDRKNECTAVSFNTTYDGDKKQLERCCDFTNTSHKNYSGLNGKQLRIIVDTENTTNVKHIGHSSFNRFFSIDGLGELMSEDKAYEPLNN